MTATVDHLFASLAQLVLFIYPLLAFLENWLMYLIINVSDHFFPLYICCQKAQTKLYGLPLSSIINIMSCLSCHNLSPGHLTFLPVFSPLPDCSYAFQLHCILPLLCTLLQSTLKCFGDKVGCKEAGRYIRRRERGAIPTTSRQNIISTIYSHKFEQQLQKCLFSEMARFLLRTH